jgi:hypothetical protein
MHVIPFGEGGTLPLGDERIFGCLTGERWKALLKPKQIIQSKKNIVKGATQSVRF